MDSDKQFDIKELDLFIPYADDFDAVIGYRMKRNDPFIRKINAWLYYSLIQVLFGLKVKDLNCGFKLFKKKVIDSINLSSNGALITAELLIKTQKNGFKIKEVGVHHYPRITGKQTGANLSVIFKMFYELWKFYKNL